MQNLVDVNEIVFKFIDLKGEKMMERNQMDKNVNCFENVMLNAFDNN